MAHPQLREPSRSPHSRVLDFKSRWDGAIAKRKETFGRLYVRKIDTPHHLSLGLPPLGRRTCCNDRLNFCFAVRHGHSTELCRLFVTHWPGHGSGSDFRRSSRQLLASVGDHGSRHDGPAVGVAAASHRLAGKVFDRAPRGRLCLDHLSRISRCQRCDCNKGRSGRTKLVASHARRRSADLASALRRARSRPPGAITLTRTTMSYTRY